MIFFWHPSSFNTNENKIDVIFPQKLRCPCEWIHTLMFSSLPSSALVLDEQYFIFALGNPSLLMKDTSERAYMNILLLWFDDPQGRCPYIISSPFHFPVVWATSQSFLNLWPDFCLVVTRCSFQAVCYCLLVWWLQSDNLKKEV